MNRRPFPRFEPRPEYYEHVSHGYDLIAETYDRVEAANAVGRRLRRRMQAALLRTFHPGQRVLEIGCGTGIEAIALAQAGMDVVATDLSAEMVARVRAKVRDDGGHLRVRQLAAHDLGRLIEDFGPASFDGAYAHGGVLNMDPRLGDVTAALAALLRPSGRFLCTVVNQASLFETVFYPLALRPRKAFRRLGHDVPIPITRHERHRTYVVPTRFYSPHGFLRMFGKRFTLRRLEGLQIFLPPWNLADAMDRFSGLSRAVEAVESRLADKPPFNSWGSLFLAELERVSDADVGR